MTTSATLTRRLGDAEVFPIGLGEMPLSLKGRPDEDRAIRTIHAALDAGVNLIDTADAYAYDGDDMNHGERLIAKALKGRRDGVIVATKGGHQRDGQAWPICGRPEYIKEACERSLRALGDRPDRPVPVPPPGSRRARTRSRSARSASSRTRARSAGSGISNASVEQIEEALGIADIVAVQNQLALDFTSPVSKGEVAFCTERGIAFLPWSPLGGIGKAGGADEHGPVAAAAAAHGVSPQQVVLAWLLALGPTVIPIPGSSRPETIGDSARAAELRLSDDEVRSISASVGIA